MTEAGTVRSRSRFAVAARWSLLALAVALVAWAVVDQWDGVTDAVARIGWAPVVGATALAAGALAANAMSWRAVMTSVGLVAPHHEAAGVFLVSQAGKYVPGAIWPVVAQAEFARAHGLSRARAVTGSLVAMAVGVATAGVVGGIALVAFSDGSVADYWWALAVALALVVVLVPAVLTRLLGLALRLTRRGGEVPRIGGKAMAASAAWSALNWTLLGAHAWLLLRALGGEGASYGIATGAFALAWLVGFLVVLAPAGVGPREAALVVLLAGVATRPEALALALVSRFAMTLADAIGLGVGALVRRSRPSAQDRTAAP